MLFNVAQLLVGPVGATRHYELNQKGTDLDPELDAIQPVTGTVDLLRTAAGVLAHVVLHTRVRLPCARCLQDSIVDVDTEFDEEFLPLVNPRTGELTQIAPDSDAFFIDEQNLLDVGEAARQYIFLALPMQPLCRPDCAGLCIQCGQDLNEGPCQCLPEPVDDRWMALAQLLTDQ
ncbi:MAG: DUF177 domain-containing protein [Chloroflexi bacterium]|nr:DUF177 domain-containing protein [Chloroflexota bacterium]MBU1746558.1 DUF177 domain-containing protein [Chloroflexota bacterium]